MNKVKNTGSLTIHNSIPKYSISDDTLIEMILMKLREQTMRYSKILKKNNSNTKEKLIKEIEILEQYENNNELINNKKQLLENLREQKLQGSIIRSRINWLHEGEKPLNTFFHLKTNKET